MDFEMEKVYNPQAIEDKLYQTWEESGAFVAHRVEGKKLFPVEIPEELTIGTTLFRNRDQEFERALEKESAERRISRLLR